MKRMLFLASLLGAASAIYGDTPGAVAITNARIIPVSGPAIARGTVVVRNGLIEAVGAGVSVPADAWVIEGEGLTVYPGLIDGLSTLGVPDAAPVPAGGGRGQGGATPTIAPTTAAAQTTPPARGPQDRPNTTSWVHAADLVKTTDSRLDSARAAGFTTAVSFPERGIFAGQGAVLDLNGEKPGQMIVYEPVGQYVSLQTGGFGGGYPGALLGAIAYIRQIYIDADYYKQAKARYEQHERGAPRPEYDRALEGVLASPRILLPANHRVEIDRMIRFGAELKQPVILYGLTEGFRSADLLKKANAVALVNLRWPEKAPDGDPEEVDPLRTLEVREQAPSTPGVLAKNGVKFAFYTGGLTRRTEVLRAIKRALDAGLSTDDALKAMTLAPAQIFGVADRLGSIEPGKIANLVVTKGDLFQEGSQVQFLMIDGVKIEPVPDPPDAPAGRRPGAPPTSEPQGDLQ